jgi:hypothetical protein
MGVLGWETPALTPHISPELRNCYYINKDYPDNCRKFFVHRADCLLFFILIILFSFPGFIFASAQDETVEGWQVLSPQPGQPILGSISIEAELAAEGVESVEISFAYSEDPTGTWFLITEIAGPPSDHKLVDWETSRLTDGDYTLRLIALLEDGRELTSIVPGLRLRNYTPVETATPTATLTPAPDSTHTPFPTIIPTLTSIPYTPTALPANPALLTERDIGFHIILGALGAGAFFAILGLYASTRRFFRH